MTTRTFLLALALLPLAAGAGAETRTRLMTAGDWAVYRATAVPLTLDGESFDFPALCVAESGIGGGAVRFMLPIAQITEVRGLLIGEVRSDQWSFAEHFGNLTLSSGGQMDWTVTGSYYGGPLVSFSMTADQSPAYVLQMLAEDSAELVGVENEGRQLIARVSSRGMAEAVEALIDCGGLPPLD